MMARMGTTRRIAFLLALVGCAAPDDGRALADAERAELEQLRREKAEQEKREPEAAEQPRELTPLETVPSSKPVRSGYLAVGDRCRLVAPYRAELIAGGVDRRHAVAMGGALKIDSGELWATLIAAGGYELVYLPAGGRILEVDDGYFRIRLDDGRSMWFPNSHAGR